MEIRRIEEKDVQEVSDLIAKTARKCWKDYYPQIEIEKVCASLNYEGVKKRASWTNFYVILEDNKIIACGAIGEYWGSKTESSLFTIFVDPDYQGNGYGRKAADAFAQRKNNGVKGKTLGNFLFSNAIQQTTGRFFRTGTRIFNGCVIYGLNRFFGCRALHSNGKYATSREEYRRTIREYELGISAGTSDKYNRGIDRYRFRCGKFKERLKNIDKILDL